MARAMQEVDAAEELRKLVEQHGAESIKAAIFEVGLGKFQRERPPSKASKRAELALGRGLSADEKVRLTMVPEVLGRGVAVVTPHERHLVQLEVDTLMTQALLVDESKTIMEGLREGIRETVFGGITVDNGGDPDRGGELHSERHGKKFCKEISGGRPVTMLGRLEEILPPEVWAKVSRVVKRREVDEQKLDAAYRRGLVTKEHLAEVTELTSVVPRFVIRDMKPEERERHSFLEHARR